MTDLLANAKGKAYLFFVSGIAEQLGEERSWDIAIESLGEVEKKFGLNAKEDLPAVFAKVMDWLLSTLVRPNALSQSKPRAVPAEDHEVLSALALFADVLKMTAWAQVFSIHSAMAYGTHKGVESMAKMHEPYVKQGMAVMHGRSDAGRKRADAAKRKASQEQRRILEEAFKLIEAGKGDHELAGILAQRQGMPKRRTIDRYLKPLRELRKESKS